MVLRCLLSSSNCHVFSEAVGRIVCLRCRLRLFETMRPNLKLTNSKDGHCPNESFWDEMEKVSEWRSDLIEIVGGPDQAQQRSFYCQTLGIEHAQTLVKLLQCL